MRRVRLLLALCLSCSVADCRRPSVPHESKPKASSLGNKPLKVEERTLNAPAARAVCSAPPQPRKPLEPLSELTLHGFVQAWQGAQQSLNFAAYASLYGEQFSGLLDTASGPIRLNRADWLARKEAAAFAARANHDRAPHIALGAGGAQVVVGGQELFVVASPSGPKIVWQAPVLPLPDPLQAEPGFWLADEEGALLSATPDASWATGPPTLLGTEQARRSVLVARLPKALRGWLGRPVRVLGASGAMCETRLQRFALRGRITPDRRTAEHWEGCADGPPIAPELIAADIWRLSAQRGQTLVAEFSSPCKGALLALDPDAELPLVAAPQPASAELGARLLDAFRALPEYTRIQDRYRAEYPSAQGSWDDHDARRDVSLLALANHAPLYFVSVQVGGCCQGFSASLSAIWPTGVEGQAEVVPALEPTLLSASARVLLRGSVDLVLLGPDGLFRARSLLRPKPKSSGAGYVRELSSAVPFFGGDG